MDITKLHEELVEKARADFEEMKQTADFELGDIERESLKIAVSKVYLGHIEDAMRYGGSDIPILLYHDKPVTAFYEWFEVQEKSLLDVMLEEVFSDFSVSTRADVELAFADPKYYDNETVQKADRCYKLMVEVRKQMQDEFEREQQDSDFGEQDDDMER